MSRIVKLILVGIVSTIFAVNLSAQVYRDAKPNLQITCPDYVIMAGEKVVFTATLNPPSGMAVFNWTVSAGTITKGQGTPTIEVETPANYDAPLTATLDMGRNLYFEPITESCTVSLALPPQARLLDEFSHSTQGYIKMMLDSTLFLELQNNPAAQGLIVIFPKTPKEKASIERIIRNQIRVRRFEATRITFVDGTKNVRSIIQFWIVPPGAERPKPELKPKTETIK
jgi:hypothetical protein